jgi:8-oxo-dGTP pyrophosphatase MutT (NUDIX family)
MSTNFTPKVPISANHVKHRETARVLLRAKTGEYLLIFTHWGPGTGLAPRWLTPGGGIDEGESAVQAAVRELREETGLIVDESSLGGVAHTIQFKLNWAGGELETGIAYFYEFDVDEPFDLDTSQWMPDEHRDIVEYRWWKLSDLLASNELIGPPGLREHLATLAVI